MGHFLINIKFSIIFIRIAFSLCIETLNKGTDVSYGARLSKLQVDLNRPKTLSVTESRSMSLGEGQPNSHLMEKLHLTQLGAPLQIWQWQCLKNVDTILRFWGDVISHDKTKRKRKEKKTNKCLFLVKIVKCSTQRLELDLKYKWAHSQLGGNLTSPKFS